MRNIPSIPASSGQAARDAEPTVLDFYDLLDRIIERTPWKNEAELLTYRVLMQRIRAVNLFGYLSQQITAKEGESVHRQNV